MLMVIGIFKLLKGALVVALALGVLRLGQEGLAGALAQWATRLHIDQDGRHFARAVRAIAALDSQQLHVVSAALCVYGALLLTEGTGLLLRRRWAEYFTVIVTGSFIPLELYEIARRPDAIRVAVCLVNVAIVWYLARELRRRT
jgi:uncharacterized membrane protein (DUF2068 family)